MLLNFYKRWLNRPSTPPKVNRPSPRHPDFEMLEDRLVPSTTFTVNTTLDVVKPGDHRLSLREAITRANNHPGSDVIVVPAGVYKIALAPAPGGNNDNGDFHITDSL